MSTKRIRTPDDDFTFWLDGDGLPQYRGVATDAEAEQKVSEILATCERWLAIADEQRGGEAGPEHLSPREAVNALSPQEEKLFYSLRDVAERLTSSGEDLSPAHICETLDIYSGVNGPSVPPLVRLALKQWAAKRFGDPAAE